MTSSQRSCQYSCSIPDYVLPTAVCTHILTLTKTVLLTRWPIRAAHPTCSVLFHTLHTHHTSNTQSPMLSLGSPTEKISHCHFNLKSSKTPRGSQNFKNVFPTIKNKTTLFGPLQICFNMPSQMVYFRGQPLSVMFSISKVSEFDQRGWGPHFQKFLKLENY